MRRVRGIRGITQDKLVRWPPEGLHKFPRNSNPFAVGQKVELARGYELLSGDAYGTVVRLVGPHKVRVKMFRTGKVVTLAVEAFQAEFV